MYLSLNSASPEIMHVDMNSSFASSEQQCWEAWRNKPVAVTPVNVPGGAVISPSYEAKALGIKVGTRNFEAIQTAPNLILTQSRPWVYREVHARFLNLFLEYSPSVHALSIDEVVIDFAHTPIRKRLSMKEIGAEIKARVKAEVGDYMRVNVGIGTNRFLAKLAAGLHKPDGLDQIDHSNVRDVYASLSLMDLPGINVGYASRLCSAGITTPIAFLDADPFYLKTQAFQSIHGIHWSQRLRGWEVDDLRYDRHGFANSHVLAKPTPFVSDVSKVIYKLTHKATYRMRRQGFGCRTVILSLRLKEGKPIHERLTLQQPVLATREVFPLFNEMLHALDLDTVRRKTKQGVVWDKCFPSNVIHGAVMVDNLVENVHRQEQLFDDATSRARRLSFAEDLINARYGMYAIGSPLLLGMEQYVPDRIAFGTPQDVGALYEEQRQRKETTNYGDENETHFYGESLGGEQGWERDLFSPLLR